MNSFAAIIDEIGIKEVADILGIPDSHVRVLKTRDSIPPTYFKRLVDADAALPEPKGVTFDLLYRLHEVELVKRTPKRPEPAEAAS